MCLGLLLDRKVSVWEGVRSDRGKTVRVAGYFILLSVGMTISLL